MDMIKECSMRCTELQGTMNGKVKFEAGTFNPPREDAF